MRALVTGGAGFAGSHLGEHLVPLGWEVTVLAAERDNLQNLSSIIHRIRVERGDLRDVAGMRKIVSAIAPDRVFHLAALPSPSESISNAAATYDVNLQGTLNLLLACSELVHPPRFLFVSSSEVFGPVPPDRMPLREAEPLRPANPYAASKAAGEMVSSMFHRLYGFPVVIARPFNHTGPRQAPSFVCSDFARQIAEIELGLRPPRIQVGNLDVQRDFSDVRDVVRGYHLLLESGAAGAVYHLGSGRPVAIREVVRILLSDCPLAVEVAVDAARARPSESPVVWADIKKIGEALGWSPRYPLEETLRDLKSCWKARLGPS